MQDRFQIAGAIVRGLAALGSASFAATVLRLTYNPTYSLAVGWCRLDRLDHPDKRLQLNLKVESIVLPVWWHLPLSAASANARSVAQSRGCGLTTAGVHRGS
ncbi:hypothetical protein [Pseudoxanthomonas sp. GM95]|uniref:hypothetical protein n=1 Tax=Pseudoxanthomonas sp. GM95 TaxID=1881043 RepID=UPI0031B5E943